MSLNTLDHTAYVNPRDPRLFNGATGRYICIGDSVGETRPSTASSPALSPIMSYEDITIGNWTYRPVPAFLSTPSFEPFTSGPIETRVGYYEDVMGRRRVSQDHVFVQTPHRTNCLSFVEDTTAHRDMLMTLQRRPMFARQYRDGACL